MVHRRSSEKLKQRKELYTQQREAKKLIVNESYNDLLKHEIVSRSTEDSIKNQLKKQFEGVIVGAVPPIEAGLVLCNDYGHGLFQTSFWG